MNYELKKAKQERFLRYLEEGSIKGPLYYGCLKVESWKETAKEACKNKEWSVAICAGVLCLLAPVAVPVFAVKFIMNDF